MGNGETSVLILLEGPHIEVVSFRRVSTPGTDNAFSLCCFPAFDRSLQLKPCLSLWAPYVCVCCQLEEERKRGIWKGVVPLKEGKGDMVIPEN